MKGLSDYQPVPSVKKFEILKTGEGYNLIPDSNGPWPLVNESSYLQVKSTPSGPGLHYFILADGSLIDLGGRRGLFRYVHAR